MSLLPMRSYCCWLKRSCRVKHCHHRIHVDFLVLPVRMDPQMDSHFDRQRGLVGGQMQRQGRSVSLDGMATTAGEDTDQPCFKFRSCQWSSRSRLGCRGRGVLELDL